jgi:AcrR family transcriptional regulator
VTTATPNRRARLRAATVDEIKQTARRLLVEHGPAAVTLRAIAREMGMTAPALYRYFPSLEELLTSVCAGLYDELTGELERVRDADPDADVADRLYAVCRQFRRWSVAHPAEFGMMFGSPLPGMDVRAAAQDSEASAAGDRFAGVFAALFAQLWQQQPFPVPARDEIEPDLYGQLDRYMHSLGADLPVGAAQIFLSCWIRIYGIVALEVFGHLSFALTDPEPMFEAELGAVAARLGVEPGVGSGVGSGEGQQPGRRSSR